MVGDIFRIKINTSEENKDSGFYALMTSGTSIVCLEDEKYIVNKRAIEILNEKKIIYELVVE